MEAGESSGGAGVHVVGLVDKQIANVHRAPQGQNDFGRPTRRTLPAVPPWSRLGGCPAAAKPVAHSAVLWKCPSVEHADIWDEEAALHYDTPGVGMFAPDVLGPTVERLRALADGGRVLEMAVGTGRVAVPLAGAGVAVSGIELSQAMIDQLRSKVDEERIPLVLGDMATARVEGEFTLVYLVFNTISNLLTQDEQVAVLRTPPGTWHQVAGSWWSCGCPSCAGCRPDERTVCAARPGYLGVDILIWARHACPTTSGSTRRVVAQAQIMRCPHRYIWPAELDLMATHRRLSTGEPARRVIRREPFTAECSDHVSVYRLRPGCLRSARRGDRETVVRRAGRRGRACTHRGLGLRLA